MKDSMKILLWCLLVSVVNMTVIFIASRSATMTEMRISHAGLFLSLMIVQVVSTFVLIRTTKL